MPSVLQPWVEKLGLRHQGVLMACIRGCDSLPKNDPSKALARCLRAATLVSFDKKPSSFIENVDHDEVARRMTAILKDHDHYPVHYLLHMLHGAEIIAYKHPDHDTAVLWDWFYVKLTHCFHLNPESHEQLDQRLGACEDTFARNAEIA
jgi:hypothetical protein